MYGDNDAFGGISGKECHGNVLVVDCSKCQGLNCSGTGEGESFDVLVVELI